VNEAFAFARLVDALRPWLDHLTIVGGWAHRLYRHTDVAAVPYAPVQTLDVDVAFALDAPLGGSIGDALAAAEFHEHL